MKKNKSKVVVALLLVLSVTLMSVAFLTRSTDTLTNTFTVGKIDGTLTEPSWEDEDIKSKELIPGVPVEKDPTITVTEGSVDAYVYMAFKSKVVYKVGDELTDAITYYKDGNALNMASPEGWYRLDGESNSDDTDEHILYIYRYATTVDKDVESETIVEPLFDQVGFDGEIITSEITEEINFGDGKDIDVKAFLHQVDGISKTDADAAVTKFFKVSANWSN